MSQVRSGRKPTPQQATHELKQRTIATINKLADRDTYRLASTELESVAQSLNPEAFGPFLSCLCDTDARQKSIVRKECVKLFATMADAHGDLLAPHLGKMVGNVVRRLKDPDSNVRDACVDAVGVMAARLTGASIGVFVRPLFDSLGEQNRHLQVGSALCLARVIDNAPDPQSAGLQRLLPRIVKLLNNHIFLGKPALLCVVGSIANAGGASSHQTLGMLIPSMQDALRSADWATRKAAAEAFGRMALSIKALLAPFKASCIASLESCRFDKVKPVRDAVNQSLQVWKTIPDSDDYIPCGEIESSLKENVCEGRFSVASKALSSPKPEFGAVKKNHIVGSRSPPDTLSMSRVKKRSLIDKKTNPTLFHKHSQRKVDNWQIEVAIPRSRPLDALSDEEHDKKYNASLSTKGRDRRGSHTDQGSRYRDKETVERDDTPRRSEFETKCVVIDHALDVKPAAEATSSEKQQTSSTNINSSKIQCNGHDSNELAQIRKQLVQIENQQSSLLELMKVFMGNSQEGIRSLETRVHGLERTVDEMVQDLALSTGRLSNGEEGRVSCCKFPGSVFLSSKFWRKNEGRYSPARLATSDISPRSKFGRETPYKSEISTDNWDRRYRGMKGGFIVNPLADVRGAIRRESSESVSNNVQRPISKTMEGNQTLTGALDRSRYSEDPSLKTAWQVSENEANALSPMQAARENAIKEVSDSTKESSNGAGHGSFWSVWTRAVDFLLKGDMESAFVEVLCPGDDILLIRLMNRTGPVLEHLSQGTILEMLQAIKQFLLKQKYLGSVIPWIQQIVDLTASKGSDYLGLPLDAKKDMLSSLQEASLMHFSDASSRKSVAQITSKLSALWTVDSLRSR